MTKIHLSFLTLFAICANLFPQTEKRIPNLYKNADQEKVAQWVDSVFNQLSAEERIGQLFTIITYGEQARKNEILSLVKNQHVGGIIFLKGTTGEQADITNAAQKNAKVPLLISIDGEWGLAMRLANTTQFPRNMTLGAIQNDSLLYRYGQEVARQCREMGIHINYAPDIDINTNPENPVIGIRAYGEDPQLVAQKGIMYSRGLESGNVLSVAKHFPGHGDTSTDSHYTLPVISHNRERLNKYELEPFRQYIDSGLSGMMIAHLNIPALDTIKQPSSLSKAVATDLLQDSLGFTGLIFTDGLAMKGVVDEKDYAVRALAAGNDILLGPANPIKEFDAVKKAVEEGRLSQDDIDRKCKKVLAYKYLLNANNVQPIVLDSLLDRLNTPRADWLNRKLHAASVTILKNDSLLPLKQLDKQKIAAVSIGGGANNPFHKALELYDDIKCINVADADGLLKVKKELEPYNTLIISVHSTKGNASTAIRSVSKDKKTILTFFTTPYRMPVYKDAIEASAGVVLAYENTNYAQEYAAQGIFGGNAVNGKIPVTVKDLFKAGEGIETPKTRLGYNRPEEVGIESEKLNNIEHIVREGLDKKAYPGCQLLIAKDGVVIYNRSFGYFDYSKKEAVTNNAIYDLASMTKGIGTAPAIMKLYDEKKITLGTPLGTHVAQLKGTDKEKITVREALLHETGLASFLAYYMDAIDKKSYTGSMFSYRRTLTHTAQFDETTWARTDYKFKKNMVSDTRKQGFVSLADGLFVNENYSDTIVADIVKSKLRARKTYLYSCLNFILLKEAVEDIAKTDLDTYLQQNFYRKLGSTTLTYNPLSKFKKSNIVPTEKDDFLRKQELRGYVHDEAAAFSGGISGNAGLFSNANDIAKICQLFLNEGTYGDERFLSERTCQLFTKTKSSTSRRGLGFDRPEMKTDKPSPCSISSPASTYGHTGFTGTCFWVDPDNNLVFIFLSNRITPKRTHKELMKLDIRPRIQEEIYNALRGEQAKGETE